MSYRNDGYDGGDSFESKQKNVNYNVNQAYSSSEQDGEVKINGAYNGSKLPVPMVASVSVEPEQPERGQWSNQFEFILSTVGYAVGLGNVWRFPYLAYENGGGSFLLPYTIMLFFAGLPLFFMELSLGQYTGQGPTRVFGRLAPAFKGLGYAMIAATCFVGIYYNVIMAWTIFYMFSGFASELPWANCTEGVNSYACNNASLGNASVSPAEDYFNYVMLNLEDTTSWSNFGTVSWQLVLCLIASWTIVCLALIKGVQSSGKVVYFTAIFPFVVLIILFIFGLTLEGAHDGIMFYLTPDPEKLKDVKVWKAAATQIFYSLGPCFGGLVTLASYNKFNNNCHRDAILVSFINCGTSVFAGFVVFSFVGFMAHIANTTPDQVVKSGPALAFIAYPEAMTKMPVPQLWSFLFFFMLLTLGLDSMFTFVETVTTAIMDHYKWLSPHKHWVVIGTCTAGMILGLSMTAQGGIYMFTLIDATCASWNILLFAIMELVLVAWMYGADRLMENIHEMGILRTDKASSAFSKYFTIGMKWYWKICWCFITPILLSVVLVLQFVFTKPVSYKGETFPDDIQALGWLCGVFSVLFIPAITVYQYVRRYRKGKDIGWAMFKPTRRWGPVAGAAVTKQPMA